MTFQLRHLALVLGCLLVSGCSTAATSNTARTAREQLLISTAIDESLSKIDFSRMSGARVYIEEKYLDCVDKPYIVGSLRHHVLQSGASVVDKREDADLAMEVRSGGVGTDMAEKFLGIPEIALPGMLSIPEIRLAENKSQQGYAKLGLVVMDAKHNEILGQGGIAMARSDDNNWFIMGIGPFQNGSIQTEIEHAKRPPAHRKQQNISRNVAFARGAKPGRRPRSNVRLASGESEAE